MTFPYSVRILACLNGDTPIELARFTGPIHPHAIRALTSDLSPEWEVFGEYPMRDADTLTARPGTKRHSYPTTHSSRGVRRMKEQKKGAGV